MEIKEAIQFLVIIVVSLPLFFGLLLMPKNAIGGSDVISNTTAYNNTLNFSSRFQSWANSSTTDMGNQLSSITSKLGSGGDVFGILMSVAFGSIMAYTIQVGVILLGFVGFALEGFMVYWNLISVSLVALPAPVQIAVSGVLGAVFAGAIILVSITVIISIAEKMTGRNL